MIRPPARIALFVAAAALGACGGEEHGDLKQELAELTKDVRGRVEPLPQVKPYEPVPYTAEGQIDPFRPERIDVAAAGSRAGASKLAPDPNRPKAANTIVRVADTEPWRGGPPTFGIASPARLAFAIPNTVNALGRASKDIAQGELRSMNVVQGSDPARLVLNLRRPVAHEASLDGGALVISLSEPAVAQTTAGGQVAHFAEGKAEAKHALRDLDFRRGRAGEGRVG